MDGGDGDLWDELSGLADAFADLGRRLLHDVRRLHAPGALPPQSLADELDRLRTAFISVRAAVLARAESLSMGPLAGPLETVKELAELLEAVGAAEQRRDDWERRTVPALGVLDRVLALSHATETDFPPLTACQSKARALRGAIVEARDGTEDLDATVAALAARVHPFASLVTMADGASAIGDDRWDGLFEAVSSAFGTSLAAAAARSRVVVTGVDRRPALAPESARAEAAATTSVAHTPDVPTPAVPTGWRRHETVFPARPHVSLGRDLDFSAYAPRGLGGLLPLSPAGPSDEVLTSIVTDSMPFFPRSLATLTAARRFGPRLTPRSSPGVETPGPDRPRPPTGRGGEPDLWSTIDFQ